ncbi:MAG: hypothetical protein AUG06_10550 [Actinobacteria bacterium 13_1_20CM_2_65_11]|nr:MAG: hypothetical protein AUH69_12735 [Actinobacteria bacterium 13_1_40CM_4_65_12]OLD25318.1 MAG: hypothetical protein AUJ02_05490 [Chloroflexi bacterium 13_1_40CM_3_65_12]OLD50605.1 MAG: hypothetical protein AUI42_02610 [Actinobacteria bacterium 13_1_40CM_2_65_8]OLE78513.1 MAG: hypothetical protein AUG06_10550 [Actinobacteria bacterium 13_1_20CM_2_65_11]
MKAVERLHDGARGGVFARAWRRVVRLTRFSGVGAAGLAVNQGLLWWLVSDVHLQYLLGAAVATVGSTTFNFIGIEAYVFRGRRGPGARRLAGRLAAFGVVNTGALIFRLPLLYLLTSRIHIHYLLSNLIAIAALTLARFALSDHLIWPAKQAIPAEAK